jgi:prepilin-type N-terminal cleavage/methylation domain-containing protein
VSHNKLKSHDSAFTIVELLVVIVIIGILAAITIISYTGITQKAIISTLQSDLSNASDKLRIYQAANGSYPTALDGNDCPTFPVADNNFCLKTSSGNTFTYSSNGTAFTLTDTNTNGTAYNVTDSTTIAAGIACPSGFIVVPGSTTYGTSSFCAMKFEAKIQGNDNGNQTFSSSFVPESRTTGTPWVNISQANAISEAATACTGCHLITETEWMTIAQNALSVASNWSTGAIGSGYIYSGHNDDAPDAPLAADSNDANGYAGEINTGGNQRRTLTLSNGQVIWDFSGNVWEWTQGTLTGGTQPGQTTDTGYVAREWNNSLILWNGFPALSRPSSTGISGSGNWSSVNGVGEVATYYGETTTHGFLRGGDWYNGVLAGILAVNFNYNPSPSGYNFGFRASR